MRSTDESTTVLQPQRRQRILRAAATLSCLGMVLGGCADLGPGGGGAPRPAGPSPMGGGPSPMGGPPPMAGSSGPPSMSSRPQPADSPPSRSRPASQLDTDAPGANRSDGPTVTSQPKGKPDWVPVFESPREAAYNDQRVIYVDRNNLQTQQLDKFTYYLARTREVRRSEARAKIQELAVLCEGASIAPATSLRGEGTEDGSGSYTVRQASTPLTSIDQFSTQRLRIDPSNPNTFVIRAICLMGVERRG